MKERKKNIQFIENIKLNVGGRTYGIWVIYRVWERIRIWLYTRAWGRIMNIY